MKIRFNKNIEKHLLQLKKYEDDIYEIWDKTQLGKSVQNKFTPFSLLLDIFEKFHTLNNRTICILYNSDIYLFIKGLKEKGIPSIQYKSLTLLTDIKELKGKSGVFYFKDKTKLKKFKHMIYDIGITNPPYNDSNSTTDTNFKKKKKFIGKDWLEWLPTITKMSAIICPTKGYSVGHRQPSTYKRLSKLGLKSIETTDDIFMKRKLATLEGIGVYYFEQGYEGEIKNDFDLKVDFPDNNLGDHLIYGSNKLIGGEVKQRNFKPGEDTLFITPKRIIIKNIDASNLNDPTRGKWRVILPQNGPSTENFGDPILIKPGDAITYSVVCFPVKNQAQGNELIEYLNSEDVRKTLSEFRQTNTNSKYNFKPIKAPSYLL